MTEPSLAPHDEQLDDEPVPGDWTVANQNDASFALEIIAQAEAAEEAVRSQLADFTARAKARAERLVTRARSRASYFQLLLAHYAEANRKLLCPNPRVKSVNLLAGRIGWRATPPKLVVEDEALLQEWLANQPASFYRVRLEPELAVLKKHVEETGEIPAGCTWEPGDERFYAKPIPLSLPKETLP